MAARPPAASPSADVPRSVRPEGAASDDGLTRITRLAVRHFGVDGAFVAFAEAGKYRCEGCHDLDADRLREYAGRLPLATDDVVVVSDATGDEHLASLPLVSGPPHVRFYAAAPVVTRGGRAGMLCLIDAAPRAFDAAQRSALADMAELVTTELALRRATEEHHIREREIRRHEARLRVLTEHALDMVGLVDAEAQLIYLSPSVEDTLGYPPEELENADGLSHIHPDDRQAITTALKACLAPPHEQQQVEVRFRHREGTWRWLHIKALSLMDRPDVEGILLNATDVTPQRRTERALQRSRDKYETLFVTANDPIVIFEPEDERILEANPQACALYGFEHDVLVGMSLKDLSLDAERGRPEVERTIEEGHIHNFETVHVQREGARVHLLISATRIDYEGRTAILSINRDVTARKRRELQRAKQANLLEMIATGRPLDEVLPTLTSFVEASVPGAMASIMLLDQTSETLHLAAGPALPDAYVEAISTLPFDPSTGACGAAAARRRSVITEDIAADPLWADIREVPLAHDLRACWSTPILAQDGSVLGTFALYHARCAAPSEADLELIETVAARVASIAIERHQYEAALRASEERFRSLVANLPGLVYRCTYDEAWETLYMSEGLEDVLGYPSEQFDEQSGFFKHLIVQEDLPRLRRAVREAVREGRPYEVEYRVRHADGSLRWVSDVGRAFTDGTNWWLDGFMLDVTERKKRAARLRVLEKALHDATETVVITDAELNESGPGIVYVNPAFEQMTGYTADEAVGRTLQMLQGPETDRALMHRLHTQLEAGDAITGETVNYRKDGTPFHVEWSISPVRDRKGMVINYVAVQRDVTERKRAERELLRISKAVEAASDGIAITDADGHVLYHNQALTDLLGYTADDINALGGPAAVYADPSLMEKVDAEMDGQSSWTGEVEMAHRTSGRRYVISLRVDRIYDADGRTVGTIIVHTDVTERKRAVEALEVALERERELSELKSRFVSMASHEMRTPLATIHSSAELISRFGGGWDEAKVDKHVDRILNNVRDMTTLLEDVLLLGKAGSDRLPYEPQHMELVAFVENLMDEVQMGLDTGHCLEYEADAAIQTVVDPALLRLIVNNLLSNAVKYAPPEAPVRVRLHRRGDMLQLEVEDEGIGIPETDLPHLFEPFHRASNVGAVRGTGLGLAIVQRAADMHGGHVVVKSAEDAGTTVTVRLPVAPDAIPVDDVRPCSLRGR